MNSYLKIMAAIALCSCYSATMAEDEFIVIRSLTDAQRILLTTNDGVDAQARQAQDQVREELIAKLSLEQLESLSAAAAKATGKIPEAIQVTESRSLTNGAHIITLSEDLDEYQTEQFIEDVFQNKGIEVIAVNQETVAPLGLGINPRWQWDMVDLGEFMFNPTWYGDNFAKAWSLLEKRNYVPGENVVIAVLDTGYTPHPNFIDNLQPLDVDVYGYNFISDCRTSGECSPCTLLKDANKLQYTPNGLDLGSFISTTDVKCPFFRHKRVQNSSWHGSHVIGTIIGNKYNTSNPNYITGGAPGATIVPIRVLGKGGGKLEDIIDGMRWAAGLEVRNNDGTLVPHNPNPVQIINMSLGVNLVDPVLIKVFQDAVDEVISQGVIIVVAAGNEHTDIKNTYPANCQGVISVAARGATGKLASYSNFGNTTITASGGDANILGTLSMIRSTTWSSPENYQSPANGGHGSWKEMQGTSMATPHVSAAIAILIKTLQSQNKIYTLDGIIEILQKSAVNYDNCNAHGCAANYALNVQAALNLILDKIQWYLPSWETTKGFLYGASTICAIGAICYTFNNCKRNTPHVKTH